MWSPWWLDIRGILRFRLPPLPADSEEMVTGTLVTGVDLEVLGALSEATWSDLTEDAELGDWLSSSLGFLEALSGV